MNAEIICVAAENLPEEHSSFISSYISKKLFSLGHRTLFERVCLPVCDEIKKNIEQGLTRSDIIIVLGGIEPETNAVAKNALSLITGYPLVANDIALQSVKDYCQSLGIEPTNEHLSAAISIKGAEIFRNDLGLCVGISVDYNGKKIFLLPYAEGELSHMFETKILPSLNLNGTNVTHTVNVFGLTAEEIELKLARLSNRSEFAITTSKRGAEYDVTISVVDSTKDAAEVLCSKAVASVKFALGKFAFAIDSKGIQYEAVKQLQQKELTIATAESCTGGRVSEMITDVSGSSSVFEYGLSAYSNRIKTEVLKVPEQIIEQYSAISEQTAMYMAMNVKNISGASLGVAITGNAGPSPSENKPVGLVYVAIADKDSYFVQELNLAPSLHRDDIRSIAAVTALNLIRKYAEAHPNTLPEMKKLDLIPTAKAVPTATEAPKVPFVSPVLEEEKPVAPTEPTFSESENYTLVFDREDNADAIDEQNKKEYSFANRKRFSISAKEIITLLSGFLKTFIPMKNDGAKRNIIKVAFLISLATLIASSSVIIFQLTADNKQLDIITSARQDWYFDGEKSDDGTFDAFDPFIEENEDVRGWISISGTKVDNPIYQTTDNEFYLTHNMNKEKSRYGALFFDYRCNVLTENVSRNLIVYGHEMKDGSMFGTLKNYKKLNFYKKNPTINLTRLDRQETYKIFSVMIMNAKPEDDNDYMFNYIKPDFSSEAEFAKWIDEARERSLINTEVDVVGGDRVITLVTCIGKSEFEDARLVIMARLTRPSESATVSTESATLNPNPRYPQAWYDKRGIEGYKPATSLDPNTSDENSSLPTSSDESTLPPDPNASSSDPSSNLSGSSESTSGNSSQSTPSASTPSSSTPDPNTNSSGGSSDSGSSEQGGSTSSNTSTEITLDPSNSTNSTSTESTANQN